MAPHFLISRPSPLTILIPKDTPPDDPSTTKPPNKTPGTTTALHIILGLVLVGLFMSLLAWMKHKFSNPTMARHAGGGGRATLPPTPSHDSTSTGCGIPDRYSSPPPIPHPRRGIKQSQPPPRHIHPPRLVTNEESFKAATPRQEPSASRHDFASSIEPTRDGSPITRRGEEGWGRSGQFTQFPPFPCPAAFPPPQVINHPAQANLCLIQTHPPAHGPSVPALGPAPTFRLALTSTPQASAPSADKRRSSSASTAAAPLSTRSTPRRRRQGLQQQRASAEGSRFLVLWHPSLSRYLCPSLLPALPRYRFPRQGTVESHEYHGTYNR